jgi:lipid II:glycine glycyltransferase (peptidoglycan interpeptide bridge formation enzyme)
VPSFYDFDTVTAGQKRVSDNAVIGNTATAARRATAILRLDQDRADVWAGLSSEARRKVSKARKAGIRVVECRTADDYAAYLGILSETARRTGLQHYFIKERYDGYWELLRPKGMCTFWISMQDTTPLSGQIVYWFNGICFLVGVCSSAYARQNGLPGNDLMQWHIIEWAHERGFRAIDWVGLSMKSREAEPNTIDRFKLKWGKPLFYTEYTVARGREKIVSRLGTLCRAWMR